MTMKISEYAKEQQIRCNEAAKHGKLIPHISNTEDLWATVAILAKRVETFQEKVK